MPSDKDQQESVSGAGRHSFDDVLVALFLATCAAAAVFFFVFLGSVPLGSMFARLGWITEEGGTWFGITLGVPCGIVCAIAVFFIVLRAKLKHGHP